MQRSTDITVKCFVTVDGTDCRIQEPTPFDKKWYSHKFKGPGVRYEVAVCIQTGWIVWVNGPYMCGRYPDLKIARDRLHYYLLEGEMYIADGGYRDGREFANTPTGLNNPEERYKRVARARHETVNSRLKQFMALSGTFRNDLTKHHTCFMAIANCTQIDIASFSPLFSVRR
jgi:hypothetical protein